MSSSLVTDNLVKKSGTQDNLVTKLTLHNLAFPKRWRCKWSQGHTNTLQNYYFTIKIQHHHKIDDFEATCSTARAILKVEVALEHTAFNIVHHGDRELVTRCGRRPVCRCGRERRPVWSFRRYSLGLPGRGGFPSFPRDRDGWCSCLAPSRLGQTGRTSRRQTGTNNVCCD